jgi:hypothetical protein
VAAVTAGVAVVAVVAAERSVVYGGDRYDGKGFESHMRNRDGGVCDNGRTKEEEEGKRTENREQRTENREQRTENREQSKEEGRTFWHTCPNGPRPFRSKSGTAKRSSFDSAQNSPEAGTAGTVSFRRFPTFSMPMGVGARYLKWNVFV